MQSSTSSHWFLTKEISSSGLDSLKIPVPIGSPGADDGAVEFWISGIEGARYFKEAFVWSLLPDDREPLVIMEGLPGTVRGREENGFIWKAMACHLGLTCHTEIVQLLRWQSVWEMRTDNCGRAQLLEDHRTLCSLTHMQPFSYCGRWEENVGGGEVSLILKLLYRNFWYNPV